MAHMEQEIKVLREELCQARDLAKLSVTTFPIFKMPIYFPKADSPSVDLPNQPEQTQHAPAHNHVLPSFPIAVRTIPNLFNRDPTIPTMQQILGAHFLAPYEPHVPPVYATGALTFITPTVVNVSYEVDQYAKIEKDARLKEDASINAQLHDAYGHPTCSPIPFFRETTLGHWKNAPSVTQSSQIDLKMSIFERFFFSFMICLLFSLRVVFPRIQILNSWSPNGL
ncbi:hypothetical protein H5410_037109 [Solanum commersonii]|uniref:Uncharacterized protein n=1 Tax=Solanum commersonii TaxID=4109 RepID=A0A9J5Y6U2_SOLCO|nr:hypothetical protein H5410_037109 [Solanum commersonii]